MKSILFIALIGATGAVDLAAQLVSRGLETRDVLAGGGWALSSTSCPLPVPLFCIGCCPTDYNCTWAAGDTAVSACCPPGSDCEVALQAVPFCANSSWALWNATTSVEGTGYFCCLPGQIGLETGDCVSNDTVVAATLSAEFLVAGVSTGTAAAPTHAATSSQGFIASIFSSVKSVVSSDLSTPTSSSGANEALGRQVSGPVLAAVGGVLAAAGALL